MRDTLTLFFLGRPFCLQVPKNYSLTAVPLFELYCCVSSNAAVSPCAQVRAFLTVIALRPPFCLQVPKNYSRTPPAGH